MWLICLPLRRGQWRFLFCFSWPRFSSGHLLSSKSTTGESFLVLSTHMWTSHHEVRKNDSFIYLAIYLLTPILLRYWRRTLGLQVRYADCGGYRFCYSCRGRPGHRPSILMLHGFSAHKDTWLSLVKVKDSTLNNLFFFLPRHLKI